RVPVAVELGAALREICGGAVRLWSLQRLKTNVYRAQLDCNDVPRTFLLKFSNPGPTRRNLLVARRWLPPIGLPDGGAHLVGSAVDGQSERVWLIFEDLGEARLDPDAADRARVGAAIDLIASLHVRSAGHPVLLDARAKAGDLGAAYLIANVRDAVRSLVMLQSARRGLSAPQLNVLERLLERLRP